MENYICTQCGTQYAATERPPDICSICTDERQFVDPRGQQWTTHAQLKKAYRNTVRMQGEGIIGIGVDPLFGIGQRALIIRGAEGLVLWDCVPLLDDGLAELVDAAGGLRAIAVSHPHFHTSMIDWSHAFQCPVFIHERNRPWVMRPDAAVHFWEGETIGIAKGMNLICCGGHFPGSAVLHHDRNGGELFTGDTFHVNPDRKSVSMMYSFPNYVPVSAATVRRAMHAIAPLKFCRVYGQWWEAIISDNGKNVVRRAADRYLAAIEGKYD